MQKIFFFFIAAIIYGSLFPFVFSTLDSGTRWQVLFFRSANPFTSLGDILGNIVLFIPYGYLALAARIQPQDQKTPYVKIFAYGLLLAFVIQVIQIYVPFRSPALADVYWNSLGLLCGFIAFHITHKYFPKLSLTSSANIPTILAALWLLYLLFPLIPSLDLQEIKNSLKPVFLTPDFQWTGFVVQTTGWLVFSHFTKGLFPWHWADRFRLPLVALLSLLLRIIIIHNALTVTDLMAIAGALILSYLLSLKDINRGKILAKLLFFSIGAYSIGSLDFSLHLSGFSWVPFSGFLEGNLFTNTQALFFKIFLLGSLIWLVRYLWPTIRLKITWIFSYILLLEVLQIAMVSHTAEITDPLLVLLLALVVHVKRTDKAPDDQVLSSRNIHPPTATAPPETPSPPPPPTALPTVLASSGKSTLLSFWASLIIFTALLSVLIKLPGVPYNVRELFRLDGNMIAILPFALFTLWFGMSIPWISRKMLRRPDFHILFFPLWVISAGLISYSLLKVSVTDEALDDVVGSSNIYWYVTNRAIWGEPGILLSNILPWPTLWGQVEEVVRFLALFSPVTFFLCLFFFTADVLKKYEINDLRGKIRLIALSLGLNIIYALPWLYLCKVIAFDHSSTDNLNELIAREGLWGGGGSYLYGLFILLTLNAVWLRHSLSHWTLKGGSLIITGFTGWFLFNLGMEPAVEKYGQVFSGVDFLLGPDRKMKLDEMTLFFRWIFLYTGSITVLAWGMRFDITSLLSRKRNKKR